MSIGTMLICAVVIVAIIALAIYFFIDNIQFIIVGLLLLAAIGLITQL